MHNKLDIQTQKFAQYFFSFFLSRFLLFSVVFCVIFTQNCIVQCKMHSFSKLYFFFFVSSLVFFLFHYFKMNFVYILYSDEVIFIFILWPILLSSSVLLNYLAVIYESAVYIRKKKKQYIDSVCARERAREREKA